MYLFTSVLSLAGAVFLLEADELVPSAAAHFLPASDVGLSCPALLLLDCGLKLISFDV